MVAAAFTATFVDFGSGGLEMMAEALPQTRRIGVLWNPTTPSHSRALPAVETAGEKLALELRMVPARGLEDFDSAFATMAQERVGAFLAVGSPLVVGQRVPLAALALKHRLPGMFPFKENVVAGGLMSYGADPSYLYRRAAAYIDKILKGAKPAATAAMWPKPACQSLRVICSRSPRKSSPRR
jgi:putative tryptophan/tyrosine transport system substrate-binding protein